MIYDDVIKIIRTVAPELAAITDDTLKANLDIYSDFVSKKYFGRFYIKALAFFIAHQLTLTTAIENEGADGSYFSAGTVTMEKEGDLQRQYSRSNNSLSTGDDLLTKTYYGQMFLQIKRSLSPLGLTRIK